jgi:hypothetical protein
MSAEAAVAAANAPRILGTAAVLISNVLLAFPVVLRSTDVVMKTRAFAVILRPPVAV